MFNDDLDEKHLLKRDKIYVSLGNYCLTSMLLKENNLKYESHPFDWMVSCIENIIHVYDNNFYELLNKNNYIIINNCTYNKFYIDNSKKLFNDLITDHQHHNLLTDADYNYLCRSINRIKNLNINYEKIIFIMIQPLYLKNNIVNKDNILKLYQILLNKYNTNIKLIIFNIVNENNIIFKKEYYNDNLIVIELDTKMVKGNHGMMYFDDNAIKKFLNIIKEV